MKPMLQARLARLERQLSMLLRICHHCGGGGGGGGGAMVTDIENTHIVCQSLECGVYFERMKMQHELANMCSLSATALDELDSA